MFRKIIAIMLCLLMVLPMSSVSAFASENFDTEDLVSTEITDEEIYNYLINAGYPVDFIESLNDSLRLRYYEGQYTYESADTSYGIFTEDYSIEYKLGSDGKVIIDDDIREINLDWEPPSRRQTAI